MVYGIVARIQGVCLALVWKGFVHGCGRLILEGQFHLDTNMVRFVAIVSIAEQRIDVYICVCLCGVGVDDTSVASGLFDCGRCL